MTIDLGYVEDRETFSFHERFEIGLPEGVTADCAAEVQAEAVRRGSRIYLDVAIKARLEGAVCDRCLAAFSQPLDAAFALVFHRGERFRAADGIEEDDFFQMPAAGEFQYDLFGRVNEALLLEMPIKFLCGEDCKGLCRTCGTNLNEGDCRCGEGPADDRWSPLKKLLNERDES